MRCLFVQMLHYLLRANHRGYIIPTLPPKSFFESKRGKDTFIKERQIELNKFLCKVAAHKGLYNTEELKVFLGYPEELTASHAWYRLIDNAKQLTGDPSYNLMRNTEHVFYQRLLSRSKEIWTNQPRP